MTTQLPSPPRPAPEWRFWLIVFAVLAVIVWTLSAVITPFIVAMLIAYFLDPAVRKMNTLGVPRGASAVIVLILFISIIAMMVIVLGPLIREQAVGFADALPGYIDQLQNNVWPRISAAITEHFPTFSTAKLQANLTQYARDAVNLAGSVIGQVLLSGFAFLNLLMLFVITPVITFYLLRDWPIIVSRLDSLLPQRYAPAIRQEMHEIDQMIAGFIRGQATVSLCLAAFYGTGLYLTGLKYGLIVGLATGLLSFIPVVGSLSGMVLALILACIQFDNFTSILMVLGVFGAAQVLDGYFLTPNLVGTRVGLHPVWIIFAVIAGGTLLGFLGVVLAVPVAGTIAILLRSCLKHYRTSRYYLPS
jgi:predicted PurR-regulated permease PerM